MKNTLANLWHPLGGVQILDLGEKRYLFRFFNIVDKNMVVKGAPWAFNNHLLVFHQLDNSEDPKQVPLIYSWKFADGTNGRVDSLSILGQDLMVHDLEDNPIESLDRKKRLRMSKNITNVSGFMDALGVTDSGFMLIAWDYRRSPKGRQFDCNETHELKCSWIGESASYQETLAYAEIISSPSSLIYEDKIGFVENGKSS
ncbi:hypothetical protein Golob_000832 [Gossypium lobatum]|uniref:DUF4283 domain-containing protein n=1 Tax=Gossypium lobatum TaxID=34289 RepID=A0A7J8N9J3_9ROSI|nr:hypothetical protein [Gossypium lobatum]